MKQGKRHSTIIVAPSSENTEKVADAVRPDLSVVAVSGQKIGNKKTLKENNDIVVYKIPCGVCKTVYRELQLFLYRVRSGLFFSSYSLTTSHSRMKSPFTDPTSIKLPFTG